MKRQNMNKPFSLRELCRRALVVLVTIAMVSTSTPFAYAAESSSSATQVNAEQAPAEKATAEQAPADEKKNDANTAETNAVEPNATDANSGEATEPASSSVKEEKTTDEVEVVSGGTLDAQSEANVSLAFDHAYIHYQGQTVGAPTSSIAVPAGADFKFAVTSDEGYEVSEVKATYDGQDHVLQTNADGLYVVTGEFVADGLQITVTAKGDPFATKPNTTSIEEKRNEKSEFVYEDATVKVTATLTDPAALPADVKFQVKPITKDAKDADGKPAYNYDAYLEALNKNANGDKVYTENDVVLYDIGFFTQKKGEDGKPVSDDMIEVQLTEGQVKIDLQFKQQQLANVLKAEKSSDIEIVHLPIKDSVRSTYDSTAEATGISANDVIVEKPELQKKSVEEENVEFSVNSLSAIGAIKAGDPLPITASNDYSLANVLEGVLGDARYFGIVAETWTQTEAETNAAVKKIIPTHQTGNDLVDSTDHTAYNRAQPWYVGEVDGGTLNIKGEQAYVYADEVAQSHIAKEFGGMRPEFITTPKSAVNAYVDNLITNASNVSTALASRNSATISNVVFTGDQPKFELDLTSAGAGVVYIDIDNTRYQRLKSNGENDGPSYALRELIAQNEYLGIKIRSDQIVVFNTTATNVTIGKFMGNEIKIKKDSVVTSVSVGKINGGRGGNPKPEYPDISKQIIWNMPNATKARTESGAEMTGIFLAPKADFEINGQTSGWLVAKSFKNGCNEWHNVWQYYDRGWEDTLEGIVAHKTLDGSSNLGNKKFSFELYEVTQDNQGEEKLILKQTKENDSEGNIAFAPIIYQVPDSYKLQGGGYKPEYKATYHYRIKEVVGKYKNGEVEVTDDRDMNYDQKSYNVTVNVSIGSDGQPVAEVKYENDQIPTFENTTKPQTVNLKITKTVSSNRPGQSNAEFPFELTLYKDEGRNQVDTDNNNEYVIEKHDKNGNLSSDEKIKFNQGKAKFKLRDGENIEIKDLAPNTYYKLTENPSIPYFTTTFNGQEFEGRTYNGTTPASGTGDISVVNTDGIGDIKIKKEIVGELSDDVNKSFVVLVKLYDENNKAIKEKEYKDDQNKDIHFDKDGIARISLKSGETKTIKGLPLGYKYSVHEDAKSSTGFEVTYSGAEGTTQDNGWISGNVTSQASLVTVTNARKGSLEVKKLVDGTDQEKQNAGTFHFTVELDQAIEGKYGDMTFAKETDNETTKYVANFDLSHNQSFTAEDLPIGVGYTVTETNPDGYIVKHNGITGATASGNLNSAELQTITFTNKLDKGSLSVKKTVDSIFADDKDPSKTKYHFTVVLNQQITGQYGDMTFEKKNIDGTDKYVAEFDLGNNDEKKAIGLPAGVGYTVTEQGKTYFKLDGVTKNDESVTVGNDQSVTGEIPHNDGTDELVYKNARDAGNLKLSKEVISPISAELNKEFTFCVQLRDTSIAGNYKTDISNKNVSFTAGYAEVAVKGGESVTIEGLPAGIGYTVTEKNETNFTLTGITKNSETVELGEDPKATGTIPAKSTDSVTIKNTRDTSGKFGFKKVVSSTNVADKNPDNKKFHFTVVLDQVIDEGKYGDLNFQKTTVGGKEASVAVIDLGHDQAAKAIDLPVGAHYTITETDEQGFTATPSRVIEGYVTSIAKEDDIQYSEITNTRSEGSLIVSKSVDSPIADDKDSSKTKFHFTVELDQEITGEFGNMEFKKKKNVDGKDKYVAEFDLGNNETCTANGLPVGVGYTVTEETNSNFNTSHHGTASEDFVDGNVVNADKQEKITKDGNFAAFKNTRAKGNLKLSKSVISPIPGEQSNKFTFVVDLDDKTVSGSFDTDNKDVQVSFNNGHAKVEVAGNKSVTLMGLPAEVGYTVTEEDTTNFKLTGITVNSKGVELGEDPKATGKITKDNTDEVSLQNTRDTGVLEVTKIVDSAFVNDTNPTNTKFEFTVQLKDVVIEAGKYGEMSFDASGKATFSLGHNQTIKASGLPVGVGYTVIETDEDGFTTTSHGTTSEEFTDGNSIENETITKDGTTATFKNTRDTGALKINKLVRVTGETGNVSMANGDYTFVITGPNKYSAEKTIKVQNGVSDPVVIDGLMPGKYTVTEKTDSFVGNMVPKPEASQTIEVVAGKTAQAKDVNFTNELSTATVNLEATKEFNNWNASVHEFEFKLEPSAVTAPAKKAPMPINAITGLEEDSESQTVTSDKRTATFGTITFAKPGTYKYVITEEVKDTDKNKGVTFDTFAHVVTVEVTAREGKLNVDKVTYDKPFVLDANHTTLKIENKYDADGKIEIAGKKNLVGRSFKENDKWTFTLSQPNGQNAPMPKATENNPTPQVITIDANKDASIKFPEITYGLEDLWDEEQKAYKESVDYTYYVTESNATENGVADVRLDAQPQKEVHVHVADNGDGTLAVTAEEDNDKNMFVFSNKYVAEKPLEVEKAIDGRDWLVNDQGQSAEEYTFTIKPAGGDNADIEAAQRKLIESNISPSVITHTVSQKHIAQFGTFKFTADDLPESGIAKYSYIVQEDRTGTTNNKKDGVTYSTVAYNVVYTVTMGEDNNLNVSAEYSYGEGDAKKTTNEIKYVNTYEAEDDEVVLKAKKTLEGRAINGSEFGFDLYLKTSNENIDFDNANWNDIKGKFALQQTKYTSGTDSTQTVTFDPIKFGKANVGKTATYVIREVLPVDDQGSEIKVKDGVTYDDTLHVVKVTTTDNKHGKYVAEVTYDDVVLTNDNENQIMPEFKNTYFGREAHISFDKQYFGTDPNAEFKFTMAGAKENYEAREGAVVPYSDAFVDSGKALEVTLTKTATQNGTVTVDAPTITYHEPGKYYYTIKEVLSQDDKNTTYDTAVIQVEVDVTSAATPKVTYKVVDGNQTINVNDNERATLYNNGNVAMSFRSAALRAMGQNAAFTNFEPAVSKILKNGILKGNDFQFAIYEGDKAEGDALKVVGNDVNGKVSFGDDSGGFKYDESCVGNTYKYTIVEVPGSDDAIVYDSDQVKLTVEVSKDANGAIIAKGSYEKGNSTDGFKATDEPTFINNYDNIVLRTIKRSREEPHDPLPGAHYGLWMVNPNGEDVYMGLGRNQLEEKGSILESNENGELYYDVPLLEGVAYYFLEEFPPPAGHLVDPYPTDYFTVVRDKDKGYRIVHEGDAGFSEYCPDVKLRD
ncbi:MAG: hypothetical protein IKF78_15365 [Atopobiaceae bacterium]|nr:hypothetical protein [Atopobiaceae bacterium]